MERIEAYTDYRKFLRDFYEDRKRRSASFSHRQFCQKAGLASPSYLREVIDGKRNLTETTLPQFIKALGLVETDASFFRALVGFNQAADPTAKREHLETMRGLRRKVPVALVPLDRYEYYSRWYLPVLRELAIQRDWGEDWASLARAVRPRIRKTEAREGIELLERLGFIAREGARWKQTEPAISSGGEVDSMAVRAGNREYARLGCEAIEAIAPPLRDISTLILGIPAAAFPQFKQELREFKDRLVRIAQDCEKDGDRVFAMNLQFFPLSQDPAEGEP